MWSIKETFKGIVRDGSPFARKYFRVSDKRRKKILNRVFSISTKRPTGIPEIHSYRLHGSTLELRTKYIEGAHVSLDELSFEILKKWKCEDFVHGDLSPSNIVHDGEDFWFIDWLPDLESYQGTPHYASDEVFRGKHSSDSDEYALRKIIGEF